MIPLYDNVLVEPVENKDDALTVINDQYIVLKIVKLPKGECTILAPEELREGSTVLADHCRDFLIDDKKYYFTRLQDIVTIL